MLRTLKKWLSWLDCAGLVAFVCVFGVLLWPVCLWGALLAFALAVGLAAIFIAESSRKYSPQNRIGPGKPIGDPMIDILILGFALAAICSGEEEPWHPLVVSALIALVLDLSVWLVGAIDRLRSAK